MVVLVRDKDFGDRIIEERKRLGIERYDEVWEGMVVMPSMPNSDHQQLVDDLGDILTDVVKRTGRGKKFPGHNVSDRRTRWKQNYRIPDLLVLLKDGKAIDCKTHIFGGPDFVVEIESPGDDTEEKVPFYSKIGVREMLIIQRDRRTIRLLRYDGQDLIEVKPALVDDEEWIVSEVLPLAFRRVMVKGNARTAVRRTDDQPSSWVI